MGLVDILRSMVETMTQAHDRLYLEQSTFAEFRTGNPHSRSQELAAELRARRMALTI